MPCARKARFTLCSLWQRGRSPIPFQGVATVERFCSSKTGGHFGTTETTVGRGFMNSLEQPRTVAPNLGLLRTHADNCADMQIHPLTRDPRGTVIGSLPKTSPSITDVGARRIARASSHLARG